MNREPTPEELIELGVASLDTKGSYGIDEDQDNGKLPSLGLADD